MTTTQLRVGAATDVGRVRSGNEDSLLVVDASRVYGVADGMGGHRGGEVASAMAVAQIAESVTEPTQAALVAAVETANRAIFDRGGQEDELRGMGTTLCAIAVVDAADGGEEIAWVNVGDSRIYLFRDDTLTQLSTDHNLVEDLRRDGQLTDAEAAVHPQRNIITRALGIDTTVQVDSRTLTAFTGDRFLMSSDGLFNEVSSDQISATMRRLADPAEVAADLVRQANDHGGRDNITCVVVDIVDDGGRSVAAAAAAEADAARAAERAAAIAAGEIVPDDETTQRLPDGDTAGAAAPVGGLAGGTGQPGSPEGGGAVPPGPPAAAAGQPGGSGTGTPGAGAGTGADGTPAGPGAAGTGPGGAGPGGAGTGPGGAGPEAAGAGLSSAGAAGAGELGDAGTGAGGIGTEPPTVTVDPAGTTPAAPLPPSAPAKPAPAPEPVVDDLPFGRSTADLYGDLDKAKGRHLTWRVVVFVAALLIVLAVAFGAVGWYAKRTYYVGFSGDQVAVFQGQPHGTLMFHATVKLRTGTTRAQLTEAQIEAVAKDQNFTSLADAKTFAHRISDQATATTTTTTTTTVATTTTVVTTTTKPGTATTKPGTTKPGTPTTKPGTVTTTTG